MKTQQLFEELKKVKENSKSEAEFDVSGMINRYEEMQYGFFPLGLGILTKNNKTIGMAPTVEMEERGVMVLGNDFGTVSYLNSYVDDPGKRMGEVDSKTIKNLLNEKVGINPERTFFTNFHLGVRTHKDATMRKRVEKLSKDYKDICFKFFVTQLDIVNPSVVICLGHDVKNALIDSCKSFAKWEPKSTSLAKIHDVKNHIIESSMFVNESLLSFHIRVILGISRLNTWKNLTGF